MSVLWLVLQRMGYAVALLVLNFTLIHLAPGDIADTIAGDMGGGRPPGDGRNPADLWP